MTDLAAFFEVAAKVHSKAMGSREAAASLNLSQRTFAALMKEHDAQIKANAKEHAAAHAHEYYLKHKDEYNERSKKYYLDHLEEVLANRKAYYSEHARELIEKQELRRQRKKQKQQSS